MSIYKRIKEARQRRREARAALTALPEWKRLFHRNKAFEELVATEKSYVDALSFVVNEIQIPINTENRLSRRKSDKIFANRFVFFFFFLVSFHSSLLLAWSLCRSPFRAPSAANFGVAKDVTVGFTEMFE